MSKTFRDIRLNKLTQEVDRRIDHKVRARRLQLLASHIEESRLKMRMKGDQQQLPPRDTKEMERLPTDQQASNRRKGGRSGNEKRSYTPRPGNLHPTSFRPDSKEVAGCLQETNQKTSQAHRGDDWNMGFLYLPLLEENVPVSLEGCAPEVVGETSDRKLVNEDNALQTEELENDIGSRSGSDHVPEEPVEDETPDSETLVDEANKNTKDKFQRCKKLSSAEDKKSTLNVRFLPTRAHPESELAREPSSESDDSSSSSLSFSPSKWCRQEPTIPVLRPQTSSLPCPFSWTPSVVIFKDFQLGRTYSVTLSLVNISGERCSCRYLGMFECDYYHKRAPLAECLHVQFQTPGQLGPGLCATTRLRFCPRDLVDSQLWLRFVSSRGEFQVEVRCYYQRADPRLASRHLHLGALPLGSRDKRPVTIRNFGTKSCRFRVRALDINTNTSDTVCRSEVAWTSSDDSQSDPERTDEELDAEREDSVATNGPLAEDQPEHLNTNIDSTKQPKKLIVTSTKSKTDDGEQTQPNDNKPEHKRAERGAETGLAGHLASGGSRDSELAADVQCSPHPADSEHTCSHSRRMVARLLHKLIRDLPLIDFDEGIDVCGRRTGVVEAKGRAIFYLGCVVALEGWWKRSFVVEYDENDIEPAVLECSFVGEKFAISIENPHVTMGICLCGSTYWTNVELVNSGSVSSFVRVKVAADFRKFAEAIPSVAIVQANSRQSIKLVFKPSRQVLTHPRFDSSCRLVDVPLTFVTHGLTIANGSLQAAVTSAELQVEPITVEMGVATVREAVKRTVHVTNTCLATQQVHFLNIPEGVSVQPNYGSDDIMPAETVHFDIIFSPAVEGRHERSITLASTAGARVKLKMFCTAVTPSLFLSSTNIKMLGVPLGNEVVTSFNVQSLKPGSVLEQSLWCHGSSFEFQVGEDAPFQLDPIVGFVPYLHNRRIVLLARPRPDPYRVKVMAAEWQYHQDLLTDPPAPEVPQQSKRKSHAKSKQHKSVRLIERTALNPLLISETSALYMKMEQKLMLEHVPSLQRYLVPCLVKCAPLNQESKLHWTLYLEVILGTCRPHMVTDPLRCVDFGVCATGVSQLRRVSVLCAPHLPPQQQSLAAVRCSVLDDPFCWRPAARRAPNSSTLSLCYRPLEERQSSVRFVRVAMGNSVQRLAVCGRAVSPSYLVQPLSLTFTAARPGGCARQKVTIRNQCEAQLEFSVSVVCLLECGSSSSSCHSDEPTDQPNSRDVSPPPPLQNPWTVKPTSVTLEAHQSAVLHLEYTSSSSSSSSSGGGAAAGVDGAVRGQLLLQLFGHATAESVALTGHTKQVRQVKQAQSDPRLNRGARHRKHG